MDLQCLESALCPDSHFTFENKSELESPTQLNKLRSWSSSPEWDCQNKTIIRPNFHNTSAIYLPQYRLHHQSKPFNVDLNNASSLKRQEEQKEDIRIFFFFFTTRCAQLPYLEIKENISLSCSVEGVVVPASGFSRQVCCKDWRPSSLSIRASV